MKFSHCIIYVFFAISAFCLCSCEEEIIDSSKAVRNGKLTQGDVNFSLLCDLRDGLEDGTLSKTDFEMYNKDEQTAGKWEFFDYREFLGLEFSTPGKIVISEGKAWEHVQTFSCSEGPTHFAIALNAVNKKLRKNYSAYVSRDFAVDEESKSLSIGETNFGIVAANNKGVILSFVYDYYGGRTHNGGQHLEIATYELSEPLSFGDESLRFNTTAEAYDWLIDTFRDTFGEEVDLNKLYAGQVMLDRPIFLLSDLISERDRPL